MKLLRDNWWLAAIGAWLLLSIQRPTGARPSRQPAKRRPRTRKLVRMLDDIYKTAIVLITEHYVDENSDLPAGEAFKALFATMRKKGWHEVRLIDATGDPLVPDNAPQDAFEREAIRQLKLGKPYYEEVVERDGKPFLRAATAIPVVMQKCTMCHDNYKNVEKGKAIGALGYTLKIE